MHHYCFLLFEYVFLTGRECGIDINECDSNPCKQGGTCIDGNATFTCKCPPGLAGATCEENIDECEVSSNIWLVSFICFLFFFTYDILVPIKKNYWFQSDPCLNNGTCTDGLDKYECNCTDTGFVGLYATSKSIRIFSMIILLDFIILDLMIRFTETIISWRMLNCWATWNYFLFFISFLFRRREKLNILVSCTYENELIGDFVWN